MKEIHGVKVVHFMFLSYLHIHRIMRFCFQFTHKREYQHVKKKKIDTKTPLS